MQHGSYELISKHVGLLWNKICVLQETVCVQYTNTQFSCNLTTLFDLWYFILSKKLFSSISLCLQFMTWNCDFLPFCQVKAEENTIYYMIICSPNVVKLINREWLAKQAGSNVLHITYIFYFNAFVWYEF